MGPPAKTYRGRVAIVIAVGEANKILTKYQPTINLWRCYAFRHNADLLLDTDDSEIQGHFRSPNWMRWFTAQKYLAYYDALLIVDPDEYVAPSCWDLNIFDFLGRIDASVVVRDFMIPQTINNGVVYLRNTPMAHFFLSLLLDKVGWWLTHAHDQGAFDETVLEMAGFEAALAYRRNMTLYTENCFPLTFPNYDGSISVAFYTLCWYQALDTMIGEGGKRRSGHIHWLDSRLLDMNHVVGERGLKPRAFIYHFAGRGKNFDNILYSFGVSRYEAGQCEEVYAFVDAKRDEIGCIPFNEGVINRSSYCTPPYAIC